MNVYIAGPYTKGDVAVNVRNAMEATHQLMDAGHAPFCPHLTHYLHIHRPRPVEDWYKLDLAYLPACDALIRLPGESRGADNEVAAARDLGIPIFDSVKGFLKLSQ